jgi:hypothetical protein
MKPEIFTSRQALVNLYNKRMKLDLKPDDVDFSTPIRAQPGQPYNTLVTISPKTHVMAIGNCKVAYNRVHVSRLGVISVDKGDAQELNINSMFLSSFIESFQEHLVGEGKLIPEEVYLETAHKIFQTTLDEVTQAYKESTNQTEKSD